MIEGKCDRVIGYLTRVCKCAQSEA